MSNLAPADQIKMQLKQMEGQFKMALPAHIKPEKFIRVAQTAVLTNPSLMNADRTSLFASCTKAAQVGLLPDGKESALVPYAGKVTFIPMYEGLLKLLRNSGELQSLTTNLVYKGEELEYYIDERGEHFKHKPDIFSTETEVIGAYSMVLTKDGGIYLEFMKMSEILNVEKQSKAKDGPWKGPFRNEMIKKTVFKRLFKKLPKSTDLDHDVMSYLDQAIEKDEEISFEEQPREVKQKNPTEAGTPNKLKEKLKAKIEKSKPEPETVEAQHIERNVEDIPYDDTPMPESEGGGNEQSPI